MLLKIARLTGGVLLLLAITSGNPTPKSIPLVAMPYVQSPAFRVNDTLPKAGFLETLLLQQQGLFDSILQYRNEWNVQIIYTRVDRGANGLPVLTHHYFNHDPARYFYPASTVKFPISMLALQRLNELRLPGVDMNTTMITRKGFAPQTPVYNDPTSPNGKPSIAHYIKKIMMVSDNDAFNRLYEWLGPEYINSTLQRLGYKQVQLLHRLSVPFSAEENRHTNPVQFFNAQHQLVYNQPMQFNSRQYALRKDALGNGYRQNGQLINGPMDFSGKNRIGLADLHQVLVSLVFPGMVPATQRFNLTPDDRKFLLKYMSQLPTESTYPPYSADTATYWPAYCKFLLWGSEKGPLPGNIRIFNKVGDAYGQLTDVAYIVDFDHQVEFFLSATIYCNRDGILNDDRYDYDAVGFPFMKNLGQAVYQYERNRERKVKPDLSDLKFEYDGPPVKVVE